MLKGYRLRKDAIVRAVEYFGRLRKECGASSEQPTYRRHKRHWFNARLRKIPRKRKWQPTPVFFPGESHGQRSLGGYKESDMIKAT